jgi:hypothetical protein
MTTPTTGKREAMLLRHEVSREALNDDPFGDGGPAHLVTAIVAHLAAQDQGPRGLRRGRRRCERPAAHSEGSGVRTPVRTDPPGEYAALIYELRAARAEAHRLTDAINGLTHMLGWLGEALVRQIKLQETFNAASPIGDDRRPPR